MRVFKYKAFVKFAKKQKISDAKLCKAIEEIDGGIIHADLGGNVLKQRIARDGKGKSGGYRTIILYKCSEMAFFVHGFAKADEDNITSEQIEYFKELATLYLKLPAQTLSKLVDIGEFVEVKYVKNKEKR